MTDESLHRRIRFVPRETDPDAAVRGWEDVEKASPAAVEKLLALDPAPALLCGVFGNAPYLARAARRRAEALPALLDAAPESTLERLVAEVGEAGRSAPNEEELKRALRLAKLDGHLTIALADISGAWDFASAAAAITRLADACVEAALVAQVRFEAARGRVDEDAAGSGIVLLAMGKQGAYELNYSSDVDLIVLFDRERFPVASDRDPHDVANAITRSIVRTLQDITADGYAFRVDLRLRPDPGATPPAVNLAAALRYYESLGQTWERAALIKARPCAGDRDLGREFLEDIRPFIWRRSLDFAAIDDLHAMKRQIQEHAGSLAPHAPGADVKRGYGGIREIEFFVQCQQLIHGGRDRNLRGRGTLATLDDLVRAGHVEAATAKTLGEDYVGLRNVEHRIQMIDDQPTHVVPSDQAGRARVAALLGCDDVTAFDAELEARLVRVRAAADELFQEAPGGEGAAWVIDNIDDAATSLERLRGMGFREPERITEVVRGWRAGRVAATRSERARGLLDRVLPSLLEAVAAADDPDAAFARFAEFFETLPAGVQMLSLFASEPSVLGAVTDVLSLAPKLGLELARRSALLDVMLDLDFNQPAVETAAADAEEMRAAIASADGFEDALNVARRSVREARFRIGVQSLLGVIDAKGAGGAYAVLADTIVQALADCARAEVARRHGDIDAQFAILALGKLGGRELSASSDLDLIAVYDAGDDLAQSTGDKPLYVDTYFARLTQRLITALSASTEEGGLYEADLQLRPSGKAGPIASRFSAFCSYYENDAWTWELMALTRARVVAGDEDLSERLSAYLRGLLTQPRDPARVIGDAAEMRSRMASENPPRSSWELKRVEGGLIDIEFTAQALQLAHAHHTPDILATSTRDAIDKLAKAGVLDQADAAALREALALELDLTQALSVAVEGVLDPESAPERLKQRLAAIGGCADFAALQDRLDAVRAKARKVFERVVLKPGA